MLRVGRVDDFPQQERADHARGRPRGRSGQQTAQALAVGLEQPRRSVAARRASRGCPRDVSSGWGIAARPRPTDRPRVLGQMAERSPILRRVRGAWSWPRHARAASWRRRPRRVARVRAAIVGLRDEPVRFGDARARVHARKAAHDARHVPAVAEQPAAWPATSRPTAIRSSTTTTRRPRRAAPAGAPRIRASGERRGSRAPKYRHLLAEALPMSRGEQAVLCVLMLRGAADARRAQAAGRAHALLRRPRRGARHARAPDRARAHRAPGAPARARRRSATSSCSRRPEDPCGERRIDEADASHRPSSQRCRRFQRRHSRATEPVEASASPTGAEWPSSTRSGWRDGARVSQLPLLRGPIAPSTDAADGVGIPLALAAGLVSFLSPCVLPLVPGYLSTVVGVTPADMQEGVGPPGARTEPAVHRELLRDLHPAGPRRDRDRLDAQRAQTDPRSRSAAS